MLVGCLPVLPFMKVYFVFIPKLDFDAHTHTYTHSSQSHRHNYILIYDCDSDCWANEICEMRANCSLFGTVLSPISTRMYTAVWFIVISSIGAHRTQLWRHTYASEYDLTNFLNCCRMNELLAYFLPKANSRQISISGTAQHGPTECGNMSFDVEMCFNKFRRNLLKYSRLLILAFFLSLILCKLCGIRI